MPVFTMCVYYTEINYFIQGKDENPIQNTVKAWGMENCYCKVAFIRYKNLIAESHAATLSKILNSQPCPGLRRNLIKIQTNIYQGPVWWKQRPCFVDKDTLFGTTEGLFDKTDTFYEALNIYFFSIRFETYICNGQTETF